MPYSSMAQAQARLKTHKGAHLSLSQVNKWASIYDAIKKAGSAKSPAGAAWGTFYKIYKKEGDHWVHKAKRVNESSIDYPSERLPEDVWELQVLKEETAYVLRPEVEEKIQAVFKKFDAEHKVALLEGSGKVHIIGSIGTNQYEEDADIDVHILRDAASLPKEKPADEWVKEVITWSVVPENRVFVGKHPIELFLQLDESTDALADAVYDFNDRNWLKGPMITPFTFDPYDIYGPVIDELKAVAKEADVSIGELERDVIDYEVIRGALGKLPDEIRSKLRDRLQSKLDEIEQDIDELAKDRKEWKQMRQDASKNTPDLSDIDRVKKWASRNALYKFLQRYGYAQVIRELERLTKGRKIEDKDVPVIKSILRSR